MLNFSDDINQEVNRSIVNNIPIVERGLTKISVPYKPKKSVSWVWQHFHRIEKDGKAMVRCGRCSDNREEKYFVYCGETSNMTRHLRNKHKLVAHATESTSMNMTNEHPQDEDSAQPNTKRIRTNKPYIPTSANSQKSGKIFNNKVKHEEKKKLDKDLMRFMIDDQQAFSIVNNKFFACFIRALNKRYNLPSATSGKMDKLLAEAVNNCTKTLKKLLADMETASISVHIWSSYSGSTLLGVNLHWLNNEFHPYDICLTVAVMPLSYTESDVSHILYDSCSKWRNLRERIVAGVSSSQDSRVINALRKFNEFYVPCMSLAIDTAVKLGLQQVDGIVLRCRNLVSFVEKFPECTQFLQKNRSNDRPDLPCQLLRDIHGDWKSTFKMIERIVLLKEPLIALSSYLSYETDLTKGSTSSYFPNASEWKELKELLQLLQPYEIASRMVCGSEFPLFSLTQPVVFHLKSHSQMLSSNSLRFSKEKMIEVVSEMQVVSPTQTSLGLKSYNVANLASVLDPRFKDLTFLNEIEKEETVVYLRSLCNNQMNNGSGDTIEALSSYYGASTMMSFFNPAESSGSLASSECDIYFEYPGLPVTEQSNPLTWWRMHQASLPQLAKLARRYLSIPAIAIPYEEVSVSSGFSTKRNMLPDDVVSQVLFVRSCQKYMNIFP